MTGPMAFPAAGACAELLLAEKKDDVYEGEVKNLLQELLERGCGTHVLSQALPELTALASLLYYGLVLGRRRPQQTLGEEYCDLMRVTASTSAAEAAAAPSGRARNVSFPRHLAWLALCILPQYVVARSKTGWLNLSQLTWTPRERMAHQLRSRQETAGAAPGSAARTSIQRLLQGLDRLTKRLTEAAKALESRLLPSSYEVALPALRSWLSQLHLAVFYVQAKYLHAPMRWTGIEFVFVRRDFQPALNLSVLGHLMIVRLLVTAALELKRIQKLHRQEVQQRLGEFLSEHAISVPPTRVPTSLHEPGAAEPNAGRRAAQRKCALCLGERTAPATTPCGHVFCWECIVGWCQKNKAECPLCRQEAHPQQIKCIYNYS